MLLLCNKEAAKSSKSQSNGAMMRISPMAVFCHRLLKEDSKEQSSSKVADLIPANRPYTDIFRAAFEDTKFTHSNEIALLANGVYCYIIVLLINGKSVKDTYEAACDAINELGNETLIEWLTDSQAEEVSKVTPKGGWVKHAFSRCLRYLRLAEKEEVLDGEYYTKCISEVLKGGGDTDTNACIVGGVLGAMIGFDNIPETPKKAVLSWNNKKGGIKRDKFLHASIINNGSLKLKGDIDTIEIIDEWALVYLPNGHKEENVNKLMTNTLSHKMFSCISNRITESEKSTRFSLPLTAKASMNKDAIDPLPAKAHALNAKSFGKAKPALENKHNLQYPKPSKLSKLTLAKPQYVNTLQIDNSNQTPTGGENDCSARQKMKNTKLSNKIKKVVRMKKDKNKSTANKRNDAINTSRMFDKNFPRQTKAK